MTKKVISTHAQYIELSYFVLKKDNLFGDILQMNVSISIVHNTFYKNISKDVI